MMGTGTRNRTKVGNKNKQFFDGRTQFVSDGAGARSQDVNLVGASSSQSLGNQSVPRNSKSPLGLSRSDRFKVQPLLLSPGQDARQDETTGNGPMANASTRERGPSLRVQSKHIAFVDSNLGTACTKCGNKHYSSLPQANRKPWKLVSAEEVKIATNNYNLDNAIELLYGDDNCFFKGNLDGYPVYVARKVADQITLKFLLEVDVLKNLRHPNIITLRAFCVDIHDQALVFNFVCSRNLSFHLSYKNYNPVQWPKRTKLAIELAKGLVYLHEDRSVIHGNINSQNVLVTHDFVPVIGDFSFASRSEPNRTDTLEDRFEKKAENKKARGYLAPEYFTRGEVSDKQDIYAFGVILIELITGQAPFDRNRDIKFLDEWGKRIIEEFELDPIMLEAQMLDPRIGGHKSEFTASRLQMIKVAKLCLQENPVRRPPMTQVLEGLRACAV